MIWGIRTVVNRRRMRLVLEYSYDCTSKQLEHIRDRYPVQFTVISRKWARARYSRPAGRTSIHDTGG